MGIISKHEIKALLRRFEKGGETKKLTALYEIRESDGDGGTNTAIFIREN